MWASFADEARIHDFILTPLTHVVMHEGKIIGFGGIKREGLYCLILHKIWMAEKEAGNFTYDLELKFESAKTYTLTPVKII